MLAKDQRRFDRQYQKLLTTLKLNDLSLSTIDVYSRGVRRVAELTDCSPDRLSMDQYREHFVDLFQYVRDSMVAVDGLGLKVVATKGAGFVWRDDEPNGLASQTWYQSALDSPEPEQRSAARTRVLHYNEDDVRATFAVREWLEFLDA